MLNGNWLETSENIAIHQGSTMTDKELYNFYHKIYIYLPQDNLENRKMTDHYEVESKNKALQQYKETGS